MRQSDATRRLRDAGASDALVRLLLVPGASQNETALSRFEQWAEAVRSGEDPASAGKRAR